MTVADRLSGAFGRDDFEGMISVLEPKVPGQVPRIGTAADLDGNLVVFFRWRSEG